MFQAKKVSSKSKCELNAWKLTSKNFYTLTETNTKNIFLSIEDIQPNVVIIDSIQTLQSNQLDSAPEVLDKYGSAPESS